MREALLVLTEDEDFRQEGVTILLYAAAFER